jgi:hypothetical protein
VRLKPGSHDEISISTSSGTFDVHKSKHKKNATFVLLMFMVNAHQRFRLLMLISSCEPGLVRVSLGIELG